MEASTSRILRALESGWADIQAHHPEVPPVVIYIASGEGKAYGHFGGGDRWVTKDLVKRTGLPEVMIAGEGLERDPEHVFGTLLHEAAHAANAALGVKDWSRGGRYHNARFKARAVAMGLECVEEPPYGWCRTHMTRDLRMVYADAIARIGDAARFYMVDVRAPRRAKGGAERGKADADEDRDEDGGDGEGSEVEGEADTERAPAKGRMMRAECWCGRIIRASATVLKAAPIVCGACGKPFEHAAG